MQHPVEKFPDSATLAGELAGRIGHLLVNAMTARGLASLVVSGGSTPVPLFERLARLDIPWKQVIITLVDERWVEPASMDSNEHLVRTHLLRDRAARATFVGLKNEALYARDGEAGCEKHLVRVPRPFDVLVLGMGSDGHTASLFPGADTLAAATDMKSGRCCMAVTPISAAHERMTLTLPAILDTHQIFLHLTGPEKYRTLEKAMADGPAGEMPIRYILKQNHTPVTICWAP